MYIHFLIVQLLAASLTASKNTTASGSLLASSCYRGCFLSGLASQLLLQSSSSMSHIVVSFTLYCCHHYYYTAAADAYLLPLTKCSYCSYPWDDQKQPSIISLCLVRKNTRPIYALRIDYYLCMYSLKKIHGLLCFCFRILGGAKRQIFIAGGEFQMFS